MAERKGHRKLRLCSKKRYERTKYQACKAKCVHVESLPISMPINVFQEARAPDIATLLCRLRLVNALPQGILFCNNVLCDINLLGWLDKSGETELCFYKLKTVECRVEVTVCLTVTTDFTWILSICGKVVERCTLFREYSSTINSGVWKLLLMYINCEHFLIVNALTKLMEVVDRSVRCEGNRDDEFLRLSNIHKGVMTDHSSKLISLNCSIF